ncbi:hypothetical protein GA0070606_0666 [Micromonospora citrea]|uniref:Uncharacterized protein n=1 Tax=Micromonospora citrea TaxID=47855 RepID=A0A1C6TUA3_9ACTN|nr:hypothetical protein [Micromonospora citrea]SCL45243.1 hypothetical protein GA0070606_0666 [Micromonospora citrea]
MNTRAARRGGDLPRALASFTLVGAMVAEQEASRKLQDEMARAFPTT